MKNIIRKICVYCLLVCCISCTGDFEAMNKSPFEVTSVEPGLLFVGVSTRALVHNGIWEYQVGDNLITGMYAQYFSVVNSSFSTDRYSWQNDWVADAFWYSYFSNVCKRIVEEVRPWVTEHPEWDSMFRILCICDALCVTRTSDLFGDIPFSEAGQGIQKPKFDTQKDIYYKAFELLEESVKKLEENKSTKQVAYKTTQDIVYGGNVDQWIKLANAIRLRLAIRISFIDPAKAKQEGEKALASTMISSNADNAQIIEDVRENENGNPLYFIGNWSDFRASATIINFLKSESSVEDPRLPLWFGKTQEYLYRGTGDAYAGQPNGTPADELGGTAETNSPVWGYMYNEDWNTHEAGTVPAGKIPDQYPPSLRPTHFFCYAEVCFLKAEAALRGWAGAGDAKTNYEAGIRASFEEYREGVTSSLYTTSNDDTYINTGKVKWSEGDTFEAKLKKIITQKWLAVYPDGMEAWTEFRRTGYPELVPIKATDNDEVKIGQFIKKLKYIEKEVSTNNHASDPGLNQGQGDGPNVRVWWDTGRYK